MAAVKFWSRIAISCLWALLCNAVSAADSATEELQRRLLQLDGVVTAFEQQVSNAQGIVLEQASGTLHLAKPRFRWEVKEPFPQIILANAGQIQIYDPDLEQVTERQIDGSLDQAPLALLTQTELKLEQHFLVEIAIDETTLTHFVLRPVSPDTLFSRLELVFHNETLETLAIFDHAGQQTLIRFADYSAQQVIQSSLFELEFPPGTDFVRG